MEKRGVVTEQTPDPEVQDFSKTASPGCGCGKNRCQKGRSTAEKMADTAAVSRKTSTEQN